MTPDVMDIDDVATLRRIGRGTVYSVVPAGDLPGLTAANPRGVHLKAVARWLRRNPHAKGGRTGSVEATSPPRPKG
jgi:hypothetical protein